MKKPIAPWSNGCKTYTQPEVGLAERAEEIGSLSVSRKPQAKLTRLADEAAKMRQLPDAALEFARVVALRCVAFHLSRGH